MNQENGEKVAAEQRPNQHTMCSYCGSVNGGHTLACSALQGEGLRVAQVSIPPDAPYWKRLKEQGPEAGD